MMEVVRRKVMRIARATVSIVVWRKSTSGLRERQPNSSMRWRRRRRFESGLTGILEQQQGKFLFA
jgi:hypothetical protein